MNILKVLPLILFIFLISCAQKTIKEKESITIGFIINGDYAYIKKEDEFDAAIKKSFLEKLPKITRPVRFNFISHSKIVSILEEQNCNYENLNEKTLEKIGNLLKDVDIIILIEPVYIKIEDSFKDKITEKCSYRKGFAMMKVYIYRNDTGKIMYKKMLESSTIKEICDKEIFKSLDIYTKRSVRIEVLKKIFDKASQEVIKEI